MSVSARKFRLLNKNREKYTNRGYIELDDLVRYTIVTRKSLTELKIIKAKPIFSTGDLETHDITSKGKEYLVVKPFQLIMVRPNKIGILIKLVHQNFRGDDKLSLIHI